jgi:lysine 6-dehydrogenase
MSGLTYSVLGAGRQGLAAAHDLAVHGGASSILLADKDLAAAQAGARMLNQLLSEQLVTPMRVDAGDADQLRRVLEPAEAALSALPYALNPTVAAAAVRARTSFADLGGNQQVSARVLALDSAARAARVTLVPDCGLAPGLAATLTAHGVGTVGNPSSVRIRCGGLPLRPRGPLGYQLTFSATGLVNEYSGEADVIRGGVPARVPTLDALEELVFDEPIGRCEAFTTSGATSTLPETFRGRLQELDYKTVRYPGHCERVRMMRDLGLWSEEPVHVGTARVLPRSVFEAVLERELRYDEDDVIVLRVEVSGMDEGRSRTLRLELMDFRDRLTGFTAMQRMTGYPAAMVVAALARGEAQPGALPLETALAPLPLVSGLSARGIRLTETWL